MHIRSKLPISHISFHRKGNLFIKGKTVLCSNLYNHKYFLRTTILSFFIYYIPFFIFYATFFHKI